MICIYLNRRRKVHLFALWPWVWLGITNQYNNIVLELDLYNQLFIIVKSYQLYMIHKHKNSTPIFKHAVLILYLIRKYIT